SGQRVRAIVADYGAECSGDRGTTAAVLPGNFCFAEFAATASTGLGLIPFLHLDDYGGVDVSGGDFDLVRRAGGDVHDVPFRDDARLAVLNAGSRDFSVGVILRVDDGAAGDEGCAALRDVEDVVEMGVEFGSAAFCAHGKLDGVRAVVGEFGSAAALGFCLLNESRHLRGHVFG